MADVVITEFMDEAAVDLIRARHSVHHDPALADRQDDIPGLIADARALIVRNRTQVTDALLAAGPKLEAVGRLGVGLDNIDMAACKARNVTVFPATGANAIAVAEYVIATALVLVRGAYRSSERLVGGEFPRAEFTGGELYGRRLGLVGFGGIAREVAFRARALGMTISAYDPFVAADDPVWEGVERVDDIDRLAADSDVISLHVPLTDATRNLFGAKTIAAMKDRAILINTARGGIIDEPALVAALKAGTLGGAAIDVFASEPLNAETGATFADCPNLILTPHIGGLTDEANERVSHLTAENVLKALEAGR
ncbi:hydroxyacid dehydrogenase [Amorphus orientalis]|uniref:(S)-sulfolactate dehydrogenase n=1 Tax=Amorphus orientalis TaxID=649198 RepID=A0AAE3VKU8_9HYPH|nr:hydroxyacid dehydrogenase [Amorphus orientalis]MDQ0313645.1 (S)-sulfolactate dehydrogenase [Amorphus orientalis]